jgi:hypothetical protein
MAARLVALQNLFKGAGAPSAAKSGDDDENQGERQPSNADPDIDVVRADEVKTGIAAAKQDGHKAGFAAANARFKAVLESDAGKANVPGAVFMLTHSNASAEDIIAKLPEMGVAAATPQAKTEAEDKPAQTADLKNTNIDLGGKPGQQAKNGGDDDDGGVKMVNSVMAEVHGVDLTKAATPASYGY